MKSIKLSESMIKLYKNRDWLYQKYYIEKLSAHKIAIICESSHGPIYYWMRKYGISGKPRITLEDKKENKVICNKRYQLEHKEELKARRKIYLAAHREERKAYYDAHREEFRIKWRAYHHGISKTEFDDLFNKQNKKCAICGKSDWNNNGPQSGPLVDHDHNTNKIRGILCHNCNVALGHLHDDLNIIRAMYDYLIKFKNVE